jgi:hypothetical protein
MTARTFVKRKLAWLQQVLADRSLPPLALHVAQLLALQFLNSKTGEAWPSKQTVARLLHMSPRNIRRLTKELETAGHLTIMIANRQHVSNRYRLVVRDDKSVTPQKIQGGQIGHPSDSPGVLNPVIQGCHIRHPNPLKRTLKSSHNTKSLSGAEKRYAFEGNLVRITPAQLEKWRVAYPALHDIDAVLQSIDDYYSENPPADGKWFFRASRWLAAENTKRADKQRQAEGANDSW